MYFFGFHLSYTVKRVCTQPISTCKRIISHLPSEFDLNQPNPNYHRFQKTLETELLFLFVFFLGCLLATILLLCLDLPTRLRRDRCKKKTLGDDDYSLVLEMDAGVISDGDCRPFFFVFS